MSPKRLAVEVIAERLRLIDESLSQLHLLDGHDLADSPIERAAAERLLQVVVDLAIDINSHLLISLGRPAPSTGRESFLDLGQANVIDNSLAIELAPSASMRNVLVHRYVDIVVSRVSEAVADTQVLYPQYVGKVARFLQTVAQ
jgi:uncharacterized protein YutE (UPF0331/DUF86 family)